jgi:molybdopterin-guanine dinucleotide biosynthesis protein A
MTGLILAGGRSSRMATPKALLPFGGEPLLVHIVRRLQPLFSELIVVAAADQQLPQVPADVVRDDEPYQGPVGGLYYGLRRIAYDNAFVTSCDAPFASTALISHLVRIRAHYDIVVPRWAGRFQPLFAVYHRRLVPVLEEQLQAGELRPVSLFDKVPTRIVQESEVRPFDPEGASFINMNTPGEYAAALERWTMEHDVIDCTVELFGVARLVAKRRVVSLTLAPGATVSDAFARLADVVPVLRGKVLERQGGGLLDGYACSRNGLEFVRSTAAPLHSGDTLAILSADAGG